MRNVLAVLLRVLLAGAAGVVGLELCLRLVLFGPDPLRRLAPGLRDARLYTATYQDQAYWTLKTRLEGAGETPFERDPLLGWRHPKLEPDYGHRHAPLVGDRRPVLLFGDSFADCVTSEAECFEGLLAAAAWGRDAALLNYGVGGFGFDQIWLCLRSALPRWEERDPVVVVAVYVGDDLNRCGLRMRTWPKPWFTLEAGELVLHPPEAPTTAAWLAEHAERVPSYLLRWLRHGAPFAPPSEEREESGERRARRAELREVCRALVLAIHDELEGRGLDHFFLLLPGEHDLRQPEPRGWQERLLLETLEDEGIPYETARPDFLERLAADSARPSRYFDRGHYDAAGNRIAFRALERGLLAAGR